MILVACSTELRSEYGARKGGSPDVWQLHYAVEGGKDHNVAADLIANPEEKCEGKSIKVEAEADGTITVTNTRTGFTKTYKK